MGLTGAAADGSDRPTILLVHGAFHAASCWDRVLDACALIGQPGRAVDLPGRGMRAGVRGGLAANVAALHEDIEAVGGPVVLCGHSMGGLALTAGGDHPAVRHLVYLAALMPAPGERQSEFQVSLAAHGSRAVSGMTVDGAQMRFDPELALAAFYHDCAPEDAAWAVERLVAEPLDWAFSGDPEVVEANDLCTNAAWQRVPSTYVVCTEDVALPVPIQHELAKQAGRTRSLRSGHSPFVSMPDDVADLLAAVVADTDG
jgi:pimeloyl-ACP methyl ester carboxylesterase